MRNISAVQRPMPRTSVSCSHDLVVGAAADADRARPSPRAPARRGRGSTRSSPPRARRARSDSTRRREHRFGRRIAVEQRLEAPVDRAGGRPRELLVADRPGELGEVRAARAAPPQVARARPPPRSSANAGCAPGEVGARLHELTSGHAAAPYPRRSTASLEPLVMTPYHLSRPRARRRARARRRRLWRVAAARRSAGRSRPPTTSRQAAHDQHADAAAPTSPRRSSPQLAVYDAPGDAAPREQLDNPWVVSPDYPDQTVPQVFLVKEQRTDGLGAGAAPGAPERQHRLGRRRPTCRSRRTTST